MTPWAGIETSWTLDPGGKRQQCGENGEEQVPGQLFLAPAPGEQFDLTVQLADQLLNYISATIYIELEYNDDLSTPPGVLIQLNGIQYSFTDRYTVCVCVCDIIIIIMLQSILYTESSTLWIIFGWLTRY